MHENVGESTSILFNVQNSEGGAISNARVAVTVEPAAGNNYLPISNSTEDLPFLPVPVEAPGRALLARLLPSRCLEFLPHAPAACAAGSIKELPATCNQPV